MLCKEYMRIKPDSRKQCSYDSQTARSVQIITKKVKSTSPYGKISTQHNPQLWCSCKGKGTKNDHDMEVFKNQIIIKSMQFKTWDWSNLIWYWLSCVSQKIYTKFLTKIAPSLFKNIQKIKRWRMWYICNYQWNT